MQDQPLNTANEPDSLPDPVEPPQASFQPPLNPGSLSTWQWLVQGLRASIWLPPRIGDATPTVFQILWLFAIYCLVDLGRGYFEVAHPSSVDMQVWAAQLGLTVCMLWLAWWAIWPHARGSRLPAWFGLSMIALLPALLVGEALAQFADRLEAQISYALWLVYGAYVVWAVGVEVKLLRHFNAPVLRVVVYVVGVLLLASLWAWQLPGSLWREDLAHSEQAEAPPSLILNQETFETQQTVWQEAVDALATSRPGVGEVFGLVYAPYASENVFLRESTLVAQVLADRFDAHRRVLHLVNHVTTADSHPWATTLNLQRGIEALAQRMDKARDVLVVYLTSHGGGDFKLAASHWPLATEPLTPQQLRTALDEAGIVNRVLIISACYSGGWVGPLATDNTLVMTAADATHTSYGCGTKSELTFFGRALFDEQLRTTYSFEQAFAQAVPVIKAREVQAGKDDGFSNPQISMGSGVAPVLKALEARLAGLAGGK